MSTQVTAPTARLSDLDLDLLLDIRHFEWALLDLFSKGELNGTTHTCLGQEYIPVSLKPLLRDGDFIFSNHRGHGHYLSRFDDVEGLLAEITGRAGAVCAGVGGSQHIFRRGYLSTGIQGESLPAAVGVGLDLARRSPGNVVLTYIGDGTWGEGAVYEGLNLAALWRIPLVVVVENNGIAQTTPTHRNTAGTVAGRAAGFGIRYHEIAHNDITRIREELTPLIEQTRLARSPIVVEFRTQRLGPHSKGDDTRDEHEISQARGFDWYERYREAFPEHFNDRAELSRRRIEEAVETVMGRDESVWEQR